LVRDAGIAAFHNRPLINETSLHNLQILVKHKGNLSVLHKGEGTGEEPKENPVTITLRGSHWAYQH
jgi:hypothetical protein